MKKPDFYFDLPEELIAQTPLEKRDAILQQAIEVVYAHLKSRL